MGSTLMGPLQQVMLFERLGKYARPGTLGNIEVGKQGYPKRSLCQKT